jgi:hypothetical protein
VVAWVAALIPLVIELVRRVEAGEPSDTGRDGLIALYGLLQDWCHAAQATNDAVVSGRLGGEPRIQQAAIKSFSEALWPSARARWRGRARRPALGSLLAVYAPDMAEGFQALVDRRLELVDTLESIPPEQTRARLRALKLSQDEMLYELDDSLLGLEALAEDLREFIAGHYAVDGAPRDAGAHAEFANTRRLEAWRAERHGGRGDPVHGLPDV